MPRRMSVAMTQQQCRARTKTVTRRKGWWLDKHGRPLVKPGDRLLLVDRVMGFKKGERATVLAEVEVVSVRRESLRVLADWCGDDEYREQCAEIRREGFDPARIGPAAFVYRYFVKAQGMSFDDDVTRIEWRYLDDEADETVARLGAQVHRLLADVVHLSGEHDRALDLAAQEVLDDADARLRAALTEAGGQ